MKWESAYALRDDLTPFGAEGIGVFALGLRFALDDLQTVAAESITDGPDDKKIDVLYIDRAQRSAFIMQCYGAESRLDQQAPGNKATDLHTAAAYAFSVGLNNVPIQIRAQVTDLRSAINDGSVDAVYFWYVHNRTESENIAQELKQIEVSALANVRVAFPDIKCTIFAQEVGRKTLEEWFERSNSQILVDDKVTFASQPCYELAGSGWACLVTSVTGKEIFRLFQEYGKDLFSLNVRDYLGIVNKDSNVNNNIRITAENEPEQFWPFNNGLTIITHDFELGDNLIVNGLAIVNGAQTTGAIGNLQAEPNESLRVAVRFYKASDQEFIEKIIRFTNSQNAIEAADFRSTDSVQRRLRQEFEQIKGADYNGGRRGSGGDKIQRKPDLLPNYTVGQALSAFHGDPVIAYNEKARIWSDNEAYSKVFKDETSAAHIIFVFSLLRAIEQRKQELVTRGRTGGHLTQQEMKEMELHRGPGAQFFLMAIIASCLEVAMDEPIPNRFRLTWCDSNLQNGIARWRPVLQIFLSFGETLAEYLKEGLKGVERVRVAESQTRQTLAAIRTFHADTYSSFKTSVLLS
jgi:hypothetical protein